ncbi:4-alpha-glucanotransferase [Streptomyces sp. NPDC090108]|uniref:4-alpha-glucanotransferase n=1 Tax=Streptomyces sp. NPDC090108 TaxID=3365947 RepID=UPI0037FFA730
MDAARDDAELSRLADLHGVATSYSPSPGRTVAVSAAAVIAALAALDVDASTPGAVSAALAARERELREQLLPPTVVWWAGSPRLPDAFTALPPGTRLHVRAETGPQDGLDPASGPPAHDPTGGLLPPGGRIEGLPPGVHRVTATAPDGRTGHTHLIVAPDRLPTPATRSYGLLVQLYSLLSRRSWGMGDLGDLAELAGWAGHTAGAGFVQVNPLHAAVPGAPTDPSPYRPSSRRFPDPVHLRIEQIPEYAHVEDQDRLRLLLERAERLRAGVLDKDALIDRDAVWELKRQALELVLAVPLGPGRQAAYDAYRAEEGQALEDHATWYALAERHGPDWPCWPEPLRDPRSAATAAERAALADRVEFHTRLAWLTDGQLRAAQRAAREAGMPVGIVHDLAVGVHPVGADAWAQQDHFAAGMSVGAPPDAFNARGQDWGLPPWRPDRLAASGHAPYRQLLRALFRYAGALRIDHVMGLFRLWWVPQGQPPTDGTYVRYDADAMLALLTLEASRAGAVVIGEDLGTVEPGVREVLGRRGVLGTSVLWFERDWDGDGRPLPPERWRADCVATATTHDLPSTAARLTGEHVDLRDRLGLLTRPASEERAEATADAAEWLALLNGLGLLDHRPAHGTPGSGESSPGTPGSGAPAHGTPGSSAPSGGAADSGAAGAFGGTSGPAEERERAEESPEGGPAAESPQGGPAEGTEEEAEIQAVHRFLLRTPARLIGVWLPDGIGDRRPQNLPGTWDQYPNWRLPVADADGRPVTLEQLTGSPRLRALLDVLREPPGPPGA